MDFRAGRGRVKSLLIHGGGAYLLWWCYMHLVVIHLPLGPIPSQSQSQLYHHCAWSSVCHSVPPSVSPSLRLYVRLSVFSYKAYKFRRQENSCSLSVMMMHPILIIIIFIISFRKVHVLTFPTVSQIFSVPLGSYQKRAASDVFKSFANLSLVSPSPTTPLFIHLCSLRPPTDI